MENLIQDICFGLESYKKIPKTLQFVPYELFDYVIRRLINDKR